MRAIHVIQRFWPYVGGSERYFYEISTRLASSGHEVTVVTTDAWDIEYFWTRRHRRIEVRAEQHAGVRILRFPVRHFPGPPIVYFGLRRLLMEANRRGVPYGVLRRIASATPWVPELVRALNHWDEPVDLVHATNVPFDSLMIAAESLARRQAAPFIVTPFIHLGEPNDDTVRRHYTMGHQIDLLRRADAVVVQTPMERNYLEQAGIPSDRLRLIGVGVNPDEILGGDARAFRAKWQIVGKIVTFLGTAAFDKGTVHLVEAVLKLRRRGISVQLVITGPRMAHVDRLIERLDTTERSGIVPTGFVDEAEKRDLLAATDVLALPSRTDSFGIVFLEAWLHRKPVIGALAGGIPGVVEDGVDGLLVRFGAVDELAAAIRRLLTDGALARSLGQAGYQKTIDRMTWDHVYDRIHALYDSLGGRASLVEGTARR